MLLRVLILAFVALSFNDAFASYGRVDTVAQNLEESDTTAPPLHIINPDPAQPAVQSANFEIGPDEPIVQERSIVMKCAALSYQGVKASFQGTGRCLVAVKNGLSDENVRSFILKGCLIMMAGGAVLFFLDVIYEINKPSSAPTMRPTFFGETFSPTLRPTADPTKSPTFAPTTASPTTAAPVVTKSPVVTNSPTTASPVQSFDANALWQPDSDASRFSPGVSKAEVWTWGSGSGVWSCDRAYWAVKALCNYQRANTLIGPFSSGGYLCYQLLDLNEILVRAFYAPGLTPIHDAIRGAYPCNCGSDINWSACAFSRPKDILWRTSYNVMRSRITTILRFDGTLFDPALMKQTLRSMNDISKSFGTGPAGMAYLHPLKLWLLSLASGYPTDVKMSQILDALATLSYRKQNQDQGYVRFSEMESELEYASVVDDLRASLQWKELKTILSQYSN